MVALSRGAWWSPAKAALRQQLAEGEIVVAGDHSTGDSPSS